MRATDVRVEAGGVRASRPGGDLSDLTDDELVERARSGEDVSAFEELVRRHRDRAYSVALRICRNPADAEDVAQEALVRAWRGLPTFRGDARFSTWMFRIVTNLALNRVTRAREQPAHDVPDRGSAALDPARRYEDGERLTAALDALDRLTPDQRACFVLRELEGLSYDELAEALGTSVQAVRGRLFRARAELAQALTDYESGDEEEVGR